MKPTARTLSALAALALSCGGSDDDGLRASLTAFETDAQTLSDNLTSLAQDTLALQTAMQASDLAQASVLIARIPTSLDAFEAAARALQADETSIQAVLAGGSASSSALAQRLEEKKGFFASLGKFLDFGGKYRAWCQANIQAERDYQQALSDIADGVDGAEERASAAEKTMKDNSVSAATEMVNNVTVELVTAPVKPVSLGGTILKSVAKGAFKKGMVAITSTKPCESDVTSSGCTAGIAKTDAEGQVQAPVGTGSIVVSGGGVSRVRVDTLDVQASPRKEVTREQVPISEATAKTVTRGDETDDIDDEDERKIRPLWMLCQVVDYVSYQSTYGCYLFDGDTFAWQETAPDAAAQGAWCKAQSGTLDTWYTDFYSEASCKEACALGHTCLTP